MVTLNKSKENKYSVYCFVTPFSSPASVKHAEKLLNCLAFTTRQVHFVGDNRVNIDPVWKHIKKEVVPTLPYRKNLHPNFASYFIWITILVWIIAKSLWYLLKIHRSIDMVICFLGLYYTPILILARLLGLKTITFEPTNDMEIMQKVYGMNWWWQSLNWGSRLLRRGNRAVADLIVIESEYVIAQGELFSFLYKTRISNLFVDTDIFRELCPLSDRPHVIGYIGRLSAEKGIRIFLSAARIMRDSGYQFRVVGDGPLRSEVETTIKSQAMSHVKFSG
jgi:glycosyltransferase involved in cell wall biosynthesis